MQPGRFGKSRYLGVCREQRQVRKERVLPSRSSPAAETKGMQRRLCKDANGVQILGSASGYPCAQTCSPRMSLWSSASFELMLPHTLARLCCSFRRVALGLGLRTPTHVSQDTWPWPGCKVVSRKMLKDHLGKAETAS